MSGTERTHRPWALGILVALMLVGSAISVYMARHHEVELYGGEAYAAEELVGCAEAEGVSCDLVNTSAWSEVFGVPTFAWAVPTYLLLILLAVGGMRGMHWTKPVIAAIGAGCVGFSGWLWYVSVVELEHVCLWCMRLYAINAAVPVLAAVSGIRRDDLPAARQLGMAGGVFVVLAGATVGVQQAFRAQLLAGTETASAKLAAADAKADGRADEGVRPDPEGPAPSLEIPVTTEDGNEATLVVRPDDAWKGNRDARVAVVEFADFECGYCKRASAQLKRLFDAYEDDILFVYKHFPLDPACNPGVNNKRHRWACMAHEASVCAQEQGRFWAFHDLLYKNNHQLEADNLRAYADAVGMDAQAFETCMVESRGTARVRQGGEDGAAIDTHGTPRIWIDGKLYRSGTSAVQMAGAIEAALGRTGAAASEAAMKMRESRRPVQPIAQSTPPMRRITTGDLDFEIDTFESAVVGGKALSGLDEIPATGMSWFAADKACRAAGKRTCSEEEWIAACQGEAPVDDDGDGAFADDMIEGNSYPYGDFHEPGRCWESRRGESPDGTPWRPVYTAQMPACVTDDGVYDLAGNVEEWVGTSAESAVLLGGAFDTPSDKARCYRRNDTFGAGYANLRTGFRCCRSVD